jgi:hypothetical protein
MPGDLCSGTAARAGPTLATLLLRQAERGILARLCRATAVDDAQERRRGRHRLLQPLELAGVR